MLTLNHLVPLWQCWSERVLPPPAGRCPGVFVRIPSGVSHPLVSGTMSLGTDLPLSLEGRSWLYTQIETRITDMYDSSEYFPKAPAQLNTDQVLKMSLRGMITVLSTGFLGQNVILIRTAIPYCVSDFSRPDRLAVCPV